ncbi:MAG: acetoin utilization protein AcuC [Gammaproteobacteria bacterium]|nr:MAG: acetoin utilization protein AcuC [Gammaproteobacteria bacterium]
MKSASPFFITSNIYRKKSFGKLHPLSGERVSNVVDLCQAMGWLNQQDIVHSCPASFKTLTRYHHADYIQAIIDADEAGKVERDIRERYNFGTMENPLFKGLYERAATTVGGSLRAAELVAAGGVAFHPSGGTHHGMPNRAHGFCYFNDPVFAILGLLDQGLTSIAYVDLDAHHGDGVEKAFLDDSKVWTMSIHEEKRWPYTGKIEDIVTGQRINLPVPQNFNDLELDYLMQNILLSKINEIKADAVVITTGADALAGDPLSKMSLSNKGLWDAVDSLIASSPRTIILGGGGYNPWTTVRCWAGLWGKLIAADVSVPLNEKAKEIFESFECDLIDEDEVEPQWLTGFEDDISTGTVRDEVIKMAVC